MKYVVTGASGLLGRMIVENLLKTEDPKQIAVSVRDPLKVKDLALRGVRVSKGNYDDVASLRDAFKGAEKLLIVSSNARASGGDPLAQHRHAIDVAKEVGVKRVFYTSQMCAAADSFFPPGQDHAATEKMLAESGLAWTSLRHGFYAESAKMMNAKNFDAGLIAAPADGKISWTAHEDLAAGDAALMIGPNEINGPTPPMTGRETLDLADLALIASEVYGKDIARRVLPDDVWKSEGIKRGLPEGAVNFMMGLYLAARGEEFSRTDKFLEHLIGREPLSMRSVLLNSFKN